MTLLNLNNYKRAKVLVKDLTGLSEMLQKNYFDLLKYGKYVPAKEVRKCIKEQMNIINIHLPKYKRIVETKGASND